MKKYILTFLFSFLIGTAFAQNNQLWSSYFSYNQVNDLAESPSRITASTQKALFSKNLTTNELKKTTTVDGLSGQDITTIYYSQVFNKTIIGHANGLILVVNENDGRILIVPGIRDQTGITPNRKTINHFYEYERKLYISCNFGVVQFNLETSLFGDTYLIGTSGEEVNVLQTTVLENSIYAVTTSQGIRSASLANQNLNDFNQWSTFDPGFWAGIVTLDNQLVGLNSNNIVYRHNGSTFGSVLNLPQPGLDIRNYQGNLIVTTQNHIYVLDEDFIQKAHILSSQIPEMTVTFTCATVINNNMYIGTNETGIISVPLTNISEFQVIKPDGPSGNNMFSIKMTPSGKLWAVYGDYDVFYNPYPLDSYGISKLSENGWLNIPYEELGEAKSLVRIAVNPSDENQIFISSFHSGLLKLQNDELVQIYNTSTPNGPESLNDPTSPSIRINGLAFDRSGNLWMNNSAINNALKVLNANGQWQSFQVENFISNIQENYGEIVIDRNGTKWIATQRNSVLGFNENVTPRFKKAFSEDDLQAPFKNNIRALAVDNRNQLWIGTMAGLRILPSVDRFLGENELTVNPIIIIDDDLPQELLVDQFITDIVVDGANNKWIGTADSGVFLLSPNGQETLYRFTVDNSPLPSNTINGIEINGTTGEVFFATSAGLVSFKGISTAPNENLSNVFVYPNPVRPEFSGTVKISGLINRANVKITDIEGNLVFETTSEGGTIEWDTKAFGKYRVASGVYMIFIASEDGTETKVKKVMIIR